MATPTPQLIPQQTLDPIFWGEPVSLVAFGISWLVKGEAILAV